MYSSEKRYNANIWWQSWLWPSEKWAIWPPQSPSKNAVVKLLDYLWHRAHKASVNRILKRDHFLSPSFHLGKNSCNPWVSTFLHSSAGQTVCFTPPLLESPRRKHETNRYGEVLRRTIFCIAFRNTCIIPWRFDLSFIEAEIVIPRRCGEFLIVI